MTVGSYDPERGVIRFPYPAGEVVLPVLTGVALARWNARYAGAVHKVRDDLVDAVANVRVSDFVETLFGHNETVVDLLFEYDESGVLGERDRFESTWTAEQAYLLLRLIVDTHMRQ